MQIRCEVKDNGEIQVVCFCLKTDTWYDYLSFKQDAREAFARNDIKAYARCLRAGLLCLFAHMEAVVNEICTKPNVAPIKSQTLCDRANHIGNEAKKFVEVPPITFRHEKYLRDMIALSRLRELKAASGKVEFDANWQELEDLELNESTLTQ